MVRNASERNTCADRGALTGKRKRDAPQRGGVEPSEPRVGACADCPDGTLGKSWSLRNFPLGFKWCVFRFRFIVHDSIIIVNTVGTYWNATCERFRF